jgi:hypothetical protein
VKDGGDLDKDCCIVRCDVDEFGAYIRNYMASCAKDSDLKVFAVLGFCWDVG